MSKNKFAKVVALFMCCSMCYIGIAHAETAAESATTSSMKTATVKQLQESAVQPAAVNHVVNSKEPSAVDKIVAYVNKNVITEDQVAKTIAQTIKNFTSQGMVPPPISDIRKRVTEELIMRKIQLDMAKIAGITATDADVDMALHNIAHGHNMTVAQFKQFLAKQGITYPEFTKQIKQQIILDRLKQGEVDSHVRVTDQEVNLILSSAAYRNQVDYNLADIIVSIPTNAPFFVVQQKAKLAQDAYDALKHGTPFYQVAAKYSNAPNALTGGNLGWRSSVALPPMILSHITNLAPGGYTTPIRLPVGFFIFQLIAVKQHGAPQMVKQYHVRHILIKVNALTSSDEAYQRILAIRQILLADNNDKAQQNAEFIKYAKAYSEDTSSINGGDIGWVSVGDTVPAFESAMLHTPVGQISQPIHSPFGWHLLEVLGVRESNLATEREKAEIRQELRDSKVAARYAEWLHEIRDMAYVKMNES